MARPPIVPPASPRQPCYSLTQDLWAATLAAFPSSTSPEDSVVGQLLIPGQLCRVALRETLIFWGAALSQEQVDATGYEQLKVCVAGTRAEVDRQLSLHVSLDLLGDFPT